MVSIKQRKSRKDKELVWMSHWLFFNLCRYSLLMYEFRVIYVSTELIERRSFMKVNIIQPRDKYEHHKKQVCAYARVSTENVKQGESLENQITYYEALINANPEYTFVGVFADFGISGTTDKRPEFKRMIELAKAGKIDLIITKSISRFARNTTVMLEVVRELKDIGVEVKFEKENISTLSGDGELMLTVLASFAQEESKNISDNVKWRIRNDFKQGKIMLNTKRFLGYDKLENGALVINVVEADIVRSIFNLYLGGTSTTKIAKLLTSEGIKTLTGKEKWQPSSINHILKNEKYKGDVLCQKTYTPNHLSPGTIINKGKVEQYYIKDHHEPIVTVDEWNRVQDIMEENRQKKNVIKSDKYKKRYPYSGILYCGKCGAKLKRRIWNGKLPSRKVVWQCSTYIKEGAEHCSGLSINEDVLNRVTIKGETIIKEEIKDGKKHYRYTSKSKPDEPSTRFGTKAEKDGSVLPSVNGSSRTVIKL